MFKRFISSVVCITFIFSSLQCVYAQDFSINQLPVPGAMVGISTPFIPLALKGLIVDPHKPLEFQFIVDTGKGPQDTVSIKEQSTQLVKYFLAGLTIPEGDLWVNLSPYEKDRIIPGALGQTDLGRDLLAQDYILKQLTASLIYPEKDLGKQFWSRVYAKAQEQFGTTNVPVNTFNKVWILPDQVQVFEHGNAVYVTKATLKVMLDQDYLSLSRHAGEIKPSRSSDINSLGSQIVRAIILPEIKNEVNTGKNFAPLRQIYQSLILAKWYKETIQNGLLDAIYTNKSKVGGLNLKDPAVKEQIYQRYLQAYKKGVFNYIKQDPRPDGQVVPRKYFSGGVQLTSMPVFERNRNFKRIPRPDGAMAVLTVVIGSFIGLAVAGAIRKMSRKPMMQEMSFPETSIIVHIHHLELLATQETGSLDSFLIPNIEDSHLDRKLKLLFMIKLFISLVAQNKNHKVRVPQKYREFFVRMAADDSVDISEIANDFLSQINPEGFLDLHHANTLWPYNDELDQFLVATSRLAATRDYVNLKREFPSIFEKYQKYVTLQEFLLALRLEITHENDLKVTGSRSGGGAFPNVSASHSKAMTVDGGIDLNEISINHAWNKVTIQFDPAQLNSLEQDGFKGFIPEIINMRFISSPLPFMGINLAK